KVSEAFPNRHVIEAHVEVFPELRNKKAIYGMFWANLFFLSAEDAKSFVDRFQRTPGGGPALLEISGHAAPHCRLCQRTTHQTEDCNSFGVRLTHPQPVNDLLKLLLQETLKVPA